MSDTLRHCWLTVAPGHTRVGSQFQHLHNGRRMRVPSYGNYYTFVDQTNAPPFLRVGDRQSENRHSMTSVCHSHDSASWAVSLLKCHDAKTFVVSDRFCDGIEPSTPVFWLMRHRGYGFAQEILASALATRFHKPCNGTSYAECSVSPVQYYYSTFFVIWEGGEKPLLFYAFRVWV